jgi:hypothetical protein
MLPTEALKNITSTFAIGVTGNAEQDKKLIETALTDYQTALTGSFATALTPFQHAGEALIDTMQRLAVIEIANGALNQFGGIFSKIATSGVDATESMIGLAGSLDALLKKTSDFVKDYYTQAEQAGMAARGVLGQLSAAGVQDAGALQTREQYRALVEAMDVSTKTGREQLNALLTLAPQFAQLTDTLKTQGGNLGDLAQLAPQIAALDPLFQQNNDAAAANASAAADATTASIKATTDAVNIGTTAVVAAVNGVAVSVAAAVRDGIAAANATSNAVASSLSSIESNTRLANAA